MKKHVFFIYRRKTLDFSINSILLVIFHYQGILRICSMDAAWKTASNGIGFVMLTCDMVRQLLSIRKQPSSLSIHHAKKASTLARFMLYPIILCHFTCHTMGKKLSIRLKIYFTIVEKTHFFNIRKQIWEKLGRISRFWP